MTLKKPRIAFYGGVANNCYIAAAWMRGAGIDAIYIRDFVENYAISQPIWEGCRLKLRYEELAVTWSWSAQRWDDLAAAHGWVAPDWVIDPRHYGHEDSPDYRYFYDDHELYGYVIAPYDHYRKVISIFNSCDLVFVSGFYAMILAALSRTPYVVCPAGSEFMIASGQVTGEGAVGIVREWERRLTLQAFRSAASIMTNTPYLQHHSLTGGLRKLFELFPPSKFERVSLPFKAEARRSPEERRELLNSTLDELGLAQVKSRFCVVVPSRVDFALKGQDRILGALSLLKQAEDFTFIFSGWGSDFPAFKAMTSGNPQIRVLDFAVSKPILLDLFAGADLVIDQFALGHIGTAAREAASVGAPVMAWIDRREPGNLLRSDLPVLNARDVKSIAEKLNGISSGKIDLEMQSQKGLQWIRKYAAPEKMARALRCHAAAWRPELHKRTGTKP